MGIIMLMSEVMVRMGIGRIPYMYSFYSTRTTLGDTNYSCVVPPTFRNVLITKLPLHVLRGEARRGDMLGVEPVLLRYTHFVFQHKFISFAGSVDDDDLRF